MEGWVHLVRPTPDTGSGDLWDRRRKAMRTDATPYSWVAQRWRGVCLPTAGLEEVARALTPYTAFASRLPS